MEKKTQEIEEIHNNEESDNDIEVEELTKEEKRWIYETQHSENIMNLHDSLKEYYAHTGMFVNSSPSTFLDLILRNISFD